VIITMPLLLAGLQIGGGLATKLIEKDNPNLARNIRTLIGGFTAGAEGMSSLAGAFKSPINKITPTSGSDFTKSLTIDGVDQGMHQRPSNLLGLPEGDSIYNIFGA